MEKKDWILLALQESPLDRLHLMKVLFLTWHRYGRNIPGYFRFEPYLYGPCSFETYSVLERLSNEQHLAQPPHPVQQWAKYYLTDKGKRVANEARDRVNPEVLRVLDGVVREVSALGFSKLLTRVYAEAPDFAVNSVVRGVFKS